MVTSMIHYAILIILTSFSITHSSDLFPKRRDTQHLCITDQYIKPIRALIVNTECCPSSFQKEIHTLMSNNGVYKQLFTHPTTAGLIIKQTTNKKDPVAPYMVALMYNTPGSIQWLKRELVKGKNNSTIVFSLGYMMRKLVRYDTHPIPTLEAIFSLRDCLNKVERNEFLAHKIKAIESARELKKKDLVTYLLSH
ncbi:hypothetical protein Noda2021_05320 [Candidatus Dependentiae bacterium Noda2021]|nr:hypothetical protein Noda2021_05320 [Candidatus Dependentiae bacterium Noda2021]